MTPERLDRWERIFGPTNFAVNLNVGERCLRLIILNNLNMDGPATFQDLQAETYEFIEGVSSLPKPDALILFTHIPLSKPGGICVDNPSIEYWWENGPIHEQNHLSKFSSSWIMDAFFTSNETASGMLPGVIVNGHDHEGCDTVHYLDYENKENKSGSVIWKQMRFSDSNSTMSNCLKKGAAIREITVRSIMGDFQGNTGLMTARFDNNSKGMKY